MIALFADEDGTAVIITCPRCKGEGREEPVTGYDPRDGSPTCWAYVCTLCDGTGEIEDDVS